MKQANSLLPNIFLDVGHEYGAKSGAEFDGIQEGPFNKALSEHIYDVWEKRALVDQVLAAIPGIFYELVGIGVHKPLPYVLTKSYEDPPILCGRYFERASAMPSFGINAHIQMHLNAAKGKYGLVGYVGDGPYAEVSEKMANIFADIMNEELARFPELISHVRVDACRAQSKEPMLRRIHYCLEKTPAPAILIEPFFIDNPKHNEFLKSVEGKRTLGIIYMRAMERISTVL